MSNNLFLPHNDTEMTLAARQAKSPNRFAFVVNPTGDPIGGGPGYSTYHTELGTYVDGVLQGGTVPDHICTTKAGLITAFGAATTDETIFVDGSLEVDMSDEQEFIGEGARSIGISGITQANPAVVTTDSAHPFVTGENVKIADVTGMTGINGYTYTITVLTTTTFELDGIDTSAAPVITDISSANPAVVTTSAAHGFVNGDEIDIDGVVGMTQMNNLTWGILVDDTTHFRLVGGNANIFTITGITQANPAVVTIGAGHDLKNGRQVLLTDIVGMTELNGMTISARNVTATTFELYQTDSTGYTAYSSGGIATRFSAYVSDGTARRYSAYTGSAGTATFTPTGVKLYSNRGEPNYDGNYSAQGALYGVIV